MTEREVLTRLRRAYFVAGGEMTSTEACELIDKALGLLDGLPNDGNACAVCGRSDVPPLDGREMLSRARDALWGMVGLVQLVSDRRYPDFPVDNHRVIEAQSCARMLDGALGPLPRPIRIPSEER